MEVLMIYSYSAEGLIYLEWFKTPLECLEVALGYSGISDLIVSCHTVI